MQNLQLDLQAGDCLHLGDFKLTLLEIVEDAIVLEIEGPDGDVHVENLSLPSTEAEDELATLCAI